MRTPLSSDADMTEKLQPPRTPDPPLTTEMQSGGGGVCVRALETNVDVNHAGRRRFTDHVFCPVF